MPRTLLRLRIFIAYPRLYKRRAEVDLVLLQGSRLEQGAKYIDLKDPERKEFTAMGSIPALTTGMCPKLRWTISSGIA